MPKSNSVNLTQTVQKGGCAAKIAAAELRQILKNVQFPPPHPDLLIDGRLFDDAGVYKVTDNMALVQTLDFFTPIVDTPYLFGQIAATNALSDVYAMGGHPKTAMGILAFPIATMGNDIIIEIMQGASDKIGEARASFVGGHSIDDDSLKFGLSVTGFVDPHSIWSNARAQVGDNLILTKPIGTGTMTAALKRKEASEEEIIDALKSMAALNNIIDLLPPSLHSKIHAATDITGFGLSGHSMQMAKASQVTFKISVPSIPVFSKAMSYLERSFLTKAHRTNAEYTESEIETTSLNSLEKLLLHDPQTSGGLLLSVAPDFTEEIYQTLLQKFHSTKIIGRVLSQRNKAVLFE